MWQELLKYPYTPALINYYFVGSPQVITYIIKRTQWIICYHKMALNCSNCFSKAIDISPSEGHCKYLCLGQLSEGEEAVKLLLKGIDIMGKQFHCEGSSSASSSDVTALDMSTAYCSLAEIYLTDCWWVPTWLHLLLADLYSAQLHILHVLNTP